MKPSTLERIGLTLVELIIVLAIISILCGLLLPAVQSARERARELVCKNNLHQLNLAMAQFAEVHKSLPPPIQPGKVGGWMIALLPFIEQQNLGDTIVTGSPIASAPASLFKPPPIFRCPRRIVLDNNFSGAVESAHYVFVPVSRRDFVVPFVSCTSRLGGGLAWRTRMIYGNVVKAKGPHHDGMFFARGFQQGISLMLNGEEQR